MQLIASPPRVR